MYKQYIKRVIDFSLSLLALILLGWFIIIVALLLYIANGRSSVFFVQERPGINARIFKLIKFKTMNDKVDDEGNLLPDKDRLTSVGRVIRSLSIDELPQLINVLKGDMSLIGPRPLLVKYLPLYTKEQMRRHEVRPGITGWAQVNGRNAITHTQKFKYDVWYVDHLTFGLDVKILFMTIKKVFKREGISAEGQATIAAFDGTN
ncbi:MAG: sugar transferase [Bacteroidales bacterium]|nr:sugar transferase [Bacteroidales bacterium]